MHYHQFCPIAKATELVGEKWTLLIIREILMGSRRFGALQRGLGSISPALLSKRLASLEEHNLIIRQKIPGMRGYSYLPTPSAKDLMPLLEAYAAWGLAWTKANLTEEDYDVELLMLYLERSIVPTELPPGDTIVRFHFEDLEQHQNWWLVVNHQTIEICVKDPGLDVTVFINSSVRAMTDAWLGHRSYHSVLETGEMTVIGPSNLVKNLSRWMTICPFASTAVTENSGPQVKLSNITS